MGAVCGEVGVRWLSRGGRLNRWWIGVGVMLAMLAPGSASQAEEGLVAEPAEPGDMAIREGEAAPGAEGTQLFVSVRDRQREPGWAARTCGALQTSVAAECLALPQRQLIKMDRGVRLARRSGRYRYHVRLERLEDGALSVEVLDWALYERDEPVVFEAMRLPGEGGELGWVERTLYDHVLQSPVEEPRGASPRYGRATLEVGAALGVGTAWYWLNTDINATDWDYTLSTQVERHRSFAGWRMDSNEMYLNSPLHPVAGGVYYTLARANDLPLWESFVAAMLATLIWEVAVEYKEIVSLNDLVLTGVAGVPLGEAYYQLGHYFRRSSATPVNRALAWVFGAPSQFHDWADGRGVSPSGELDAMGWPSDSWRRFRLRLGAGAATPRARWEGGTPEGARQDVHLEAGSELVFLPGYRSAGRQFGWEVGTLATRLRGEFAGGTAGVHRWGFEGGVDLAGWYGQSMLRGEDGGRGLGAFLGTGMGFRHEEHVYGDELDRFGMMHLPGVVAEHWGARGRVGWRLRYGISPDFSAIDSRVLPEYAPDGNMEGQRGSLAEGYYFGWGLTQELGLELDIARVHVRADWRQHRVWSIQGVDRLQESIEDELELYDRVDVGRLELMSSWPVERVRLGTVLERRGRLGRIDDRERRVQEWRGMWMFELVY
ncbi:hypothetical protein DL240_06910 [Lujinxingia litoralis]|uniref:DUF3943 domain-containing protein n=1 Tax=Lujinxingia litoralis TaxID=2211119 RepID=A0A328C7M9_9DELT|nr:DUF3943 domain-containing protein [Lujinxingia litoralis]RAL23873.1 hypothetical protein DL240_06910 [Lujinxingia litoralis]